jgi:hypothetical protein
MAKWLLYQNSSGFYTLKYRNPVTNTDFTCGELRLDTPRKMILQWILEQNTYSQGDVVCFPGETLLAAKEARA